MIGKYIKASLTLLILFLFFYSNAADTTYYEIWEINSLSEISGHNVEFTGNPQVVNTDIGEAVQFDGDGDRLLIDANPIGDAMEFTIEVVFKPDAGINIINEPRFIHIQDPDDPQGKRVMMEIRVNNENNWYLDGYMNTDSENLTLIDEKLTHPTAEWMHAAITYKHTIFKTYVNGEEELTGSVSYNSKIINSTGKTSIGARMNERNWYSGLIKTLKITHEALSPDKFIFINNDSSGVNADNLISVDNSIKVFPNPAGNLVTIYANKLAAGSFLAIYNIFGEKVFYIDLFENIVKNTVQLNTSEFDDGFYVCTIINNGVSYSVKFLVKH